MLSQTYKLAALAAIAGQVGPPGRVLLAECEQPGLRSARAVANLADPSPEDSPGITEKLDSLEFPSLRPAVWPDPAWYLSAATITSCISCVGASWRKRNLFLGTQHGTQPYLDLVDHILAENSLLEKSIVEL